MKSNDHQRSPRYLETTTNLVREGAYLDSTPNGISIPTVTSGSILLQTTINDHKKHTARLSPVVWEAKYELERRGLVVFLLRSAGTVPLDIIAWDNRFSYGIAVRRTRSDPDVREISSRFSSLIATLRSINLPMTYRLELWIYYRSTVRVYEILDGGLMNRSLP